jgi:hypothetical protein
MCYKDLSKPLHSLGAKTFLNEAEEKNATGTVASVPTGLLATLISAPTGIYCIGDTHMLRYYHVRIRRGDIYVGSADSILRH